MDKNRQTTERGLIALFAVASGLSVANVYYAQPLLDALAQSFAISQAAVGGVVTATQVGSALALLLLVPLGDIVERRRLLLVQLLALMIALSAVALAQSAVVLLTGMLATGLLGTAMTQGLIASAASIASEQERGRVVGAMATIVIYARFGWQGVCLLGASVSLLALIVWSTTRRWMRLNNTP